ncbi:hypothetical protein HZH68_011047 [Vespula germanica]|uniref:Nucleolar protein 10 n=2 Tax=Vespula TaxID=7451 RepID=A0A834N1F4_VESGE|nr:hypothetical protein HZH68_011047 [Vespula germanica]
MTNLKTISNEFEIVVEECTFLEAVIETTRNLQRKWPSTATWYDRRRVTGLSGVSVDRNVSVTKIDFFVVTSTSARKELLEDRPGKASKNRKKVHQSVRRMYLMYYLNENGDRVYTLKKLDPNGKPTMSAHPARFSPEDKYSRERITLKRRYGLLLTQAPMPVY